MYRCDRRICGSALAVMGLVTALVGCSGDDAGTTATDGTATTSGTASSGTASSGTASSGTASSGTASTESETDADPPHQAMAVAAGGIHNCAVGTDGGLWCWGDGEVGQIGIGEVFLATEVPVPVGGESDWIDVGAGGLHTCARKQDGTLWCWGDDDLGQLGVPATDVCIFNNEDHACVLSPTQVGADTDWVEMGGGYVHTCARKQDGTLWCWGRSASFGPAAAQVCGIDAEPCEPSPAQIGLASDWATLGLGSNHVCAVKTDGTLWCWGGTLGEVPAQVEADADWAEAAGGYDYRCGTRQGGTLWCWGEGAILGQLGDGSLNPSVAPRQIGLHTDWSGLVGTQHFACALKGGGTIWCWGSNSHFQAGETQEVECGQPCTPQPRAIGQDSDWTVIATGHDHACAIDKDGVVACWGSNLRRQLGSDVGPYSGAPVPVGLQ